MCSRVLPEALYNSFTRKISARVDPAIVRAVCVDHTKILAKVTIRRLPSEGELLTREEQAGFHNDHVHNIFTTEQNIMPRGTHQQRTIRLTVELMNPTDSFGVHFDERRSSQILKHPQSDIWCEFWL
ncbi:hypothetical protein T265_04517 [Opisthorchis viverrini]|uniref:Uncharacterized protein n=1 Tax=Opisthorchis viverrini TaxID=6198 RepID=A0A074ZNQ7_OPIVI|nr:hypothetical protein T265_04517 [Opisthorchis viverrini]KER28731.1 hypothetical protein T265_04517 [Opisthorchis viverrini]